MIKVAPSILSADFSRLAEDIALIEKEADLLHIDVMDGQFVPNLTIGPVVVQTIRRKSKLPFDVHLMVKNPEKLFGPFHKAGADYISFHAEAVEDVNEVLEELKKLKVKRGIAINPDTPASSIINILDQIHLVTVMSVFPGFAGQRFIRESLLAVKELKVIRESRSLNFEIEIDGGINLETAKEAVEAGVDILVAGSYVFKSRNPAKTVAALKNIGQ